MACAANRAATSARKTFSKAALAASCAAQRFPLATPVSPRTNASRVKIHSCLSSTAGVRAQATLRICIAIRRPTAVCAKTDTG
jgi:hypothetical protein